MRKKKAPAVIKVEKINELHTATNITNETINKDAKNEPILLTTTKSKLNTILEEKNNKEEKENIFNINNIDENIDIVVNNIERKKSKKSKKSKKKNTDIIKLKNNILINKDYKYENLINYIKCNKSKIINILYKKKNIKI